MTTLFSLTIFLSSFLLFFLELLAGKKLLPLFGGSSAVWTCCLFFFQIVLLAGYTYAHLISNHLKKRAFLIFHIILAIIVVIYQSLAVRIQPENVDYFHPLNSLFKWLGVYIGVPFFLLSTTSPMLQKWFSLTGNKRSADPYFLSVASNTGSLLCLIGYVCLIEPTLSVDYQTTIFNSCFIILVCLLVICGILTLNKNQSEEIIPISKQSSDNFNQKNRARLNSIIYWICYAFVPSSLMLGVTSNITTNVAPVPLLWVLPLALYLLSYIFAFMQKPIIPFEFLDRWFPFILIITSPFSFLTVYNNVILTVTVQLFHFFIIALYCHYRLFILRPDTSELTLFYSVTALGGTLGSVFNSLLAPLVFNDYYEYFIIIIFGIILYGIRSKDRLEISKVNQSIFTLLILSTVICHIAVKYFHNTTHYNYEILIYGILSLFCYYFRFYPLLFSSAFSLALICLYSLQGSKDIVIRKSLRNFYGVKKIAHDYNKNLAFLQHGNINHGAQHLSKEKSLIPTAYYHKTGPIKDIFELFNDQNLEDKVGIVGLGTGGMQCYAKTGETFTYYELDPEVARIAGNDSFFTYLSHGPGKNKIEIGDGRLLLNNVKDNSLKLLVLDAFSSDAVPIHLLTKEAFDIYAKKIVSDGVIVFHISNQYITLEPPVSLAAESQQFSSFVREDTIINKDEALDGKTPSIYLITTKNQEIISRIENKEGWRAARPDRSKKVFSDDYSDIFSYIKFSY